MNAHEEGANVQPDRLLNNGLGIVGIQPRQGDRPLNLSLRTRPSAVRAAMMNRAAWGAAATVLLPVAATAIWLIDRSPLWLAAAAGMTAQLLLVVVRRKLRRRITNGTRALRTLSRELLRSLATSHAGNEIWSLAQHLSSALEQTSVSIALLDEGGRFFRERVSTQLQPKPHIVSAGALACYAERLQAGRWFARSPAIETEELGSILNRSQIQSCLPINYDGTTIGLIWFARLESVLSRQGKELLDDVGRETAAMLATVRLRELASIDPLTELPRRHIAEDRIAYELERSFRSNAPLSLCMVDIDHFKRVNDQYGHAVGDTVLRYVARVLRLESRRIDLVARWGGEEFMIVLPETDDLGAEAVAEKLRAAVEGTSIEVAGHTLRITASFGVTQIIPLVEPDAEHAIERVDEALYQAKNDGRNRVQRHAGLLAGINDPVTALVN